MSRGLIFTRKDADFRIENKNRQSPEDLIAVNPNLSEKDKDQVKCEIWLKRDMQEKLEMERLEREAIEAEKIRLAEIERLRVNDNRW